MGSRQGKLSRFAVLALPGAVAGLLRGAIVVAEAWRASGGPPAPWMEIVSFVARAALLVSALLCMVGAIVWIFHRLMRSAEGARWPDRVVRALAWGMVVAGIIGGTPALPAGAVVTAVVAWKCRAPIMVFGRPWLVHALLVALALLPGAPEPPEVTEARVNARPDLLFLLVDTLRADHLGCYGYGPDTSPTLDSLAASGVLFERAYAQWTRTAPAHATIFTGRFPHDHGLLANGQVLPSHLPVLAEDLRDAGYLTAAFVTNPFLGRRFGFDRGFDVYVEPRDFSLRGTPVSAWWRRVRLVEAVDRWLGRDVVGTLARDWLRHQVTGQPVALFVQWIDPHMPYSPPPPLLEAFDEGYRGLLRGRRAQIDAINEGRLELSDRDIQHMIARYDGEIRRVDARIGRVLEAWRNTRGSSVVVMTADHGENMAEHDEWFRHPSHVYDSVARVPFLLSGIGMPGPLPVGVVVPDPVMHRDIAPTVRTLLGIESNSGDADVGLAGLVAYRSVGKLLGPTGDGIGTPESVGAVVEAAVADQRRTAWIEEDWKLIREVGLSGQRWILHDLTRDPGESRDLYDERPDVARVLEERLNEWIDAEAPGAEEFLLDPRPISKDALDPATTKMLRALGYL